MIPPPNEWPQKTPFLEKEKRKKKKSRADSRMGFASLTKSGDSVLAQQAVDAEPQLLVDNEAQDGEITWSRWLRTIDFMCYVLVFVGVILAATGGDTIAIREFMPRGVFFLFCFFFFFFSFLILCSLALISPHMNHIICKNPMQKKCIFKTIYANPQLF
jgi:hypothetical protein